MKTRCVFVFAAITLQLSTASYGQVPCARAQNSFADNGVEELINAATGGQQPATDSLTAAADVGASPAAQPGLAQAQAQLQALNSNPSYQSLKNSDAIAETLAENSLAANIRQGNINVVAPHVVGQTAYRSLLVPHGINNHQVIATQPLQPIVVNQPGSPPAQINSGPPAIVRASPVVYKLKPSIIYQQEVINKVPTPLSLNPVYVKVYKPGKQVDAPIASGYGQPAGSYGTAASSASAAAAANEAAYGAPQYASAPQYVNAPPQYAVPQSSYGAQSAY